MIIRERKHTNWFLFESVAVKRISLAQRTNDFINEWNYAEQRQRY